MDGIKLPEAYFCRRVTETRVLGPCWGKFTCLAEFLIGRGSLSIHRRPRSRRGWVVELIRTMIPTDAEAAKIQIDEER